SRGPHPVIVMANGLGCNKLLGLAAYAEEFCVAGYACLVFDYRHGTRRNSVYVSEQQDDYRTVIKYARQQPQYDPHRILPVLNVAASMAQNPYCGRSFPLFQFNRRYITLFTFGILDLLADFLHLPPVYIPTVGPPGAIVSISAHGAVEGFDSVAKDPSDFPNQISASIFFRAPLHHRPRDALHLIHRPIFKLLTAAKADRICPPAPVVETSRIVPTAELVQVSGDHFDIFKGNADWEQAIATQLAFLRKYVPV
ncbi:hypothetical protein K438DRAFT_1858750, partial [Mycena galopus ATCC 62051]